MFRLFLQNSILLFIILILVETFLKRGLSLLESEKKVEEVVEEKVEEVVEQKSEEKTQPKGIFSKIKNLFKK